MLTYIFMLAWLGVTAFTSLPVFMYFNIWTICQNMTVLEGASLCLDPRQFGMFHNLGVSLTDICFVAVILTGWLSKLKVLCRLERRRLYVQDQRSSSKCVNRMRSV